MAPQQIARDSKVDIIIDDDDDDDDEDDELQQQQQQYHMERRLSYRQWKG
jgi:hypothetical protein